MQGDSAASKKLAETASDSSSSSSSSVAAAAAACQPLILGSSSKWRARIITEMGLTVTRQMNPDIDEYSIVPDGVELKDRLKCAPEELSLAVARAKAAHLMAQLKAEQKEAAEASASSSSSSSSSSHPTPTPSFLITSDQVAYFDSEIREKPTSAEQCRSWMREYTQSPVCVCTAIVVTNTSNGKRYEGTATAAQFFSRHLPDSVIDELIQQGDILSCCGGFLIDQPAIIPYLSTRVGTEDELRGMPKSRLSRLLAEAQADWDVIQQEVTELLAIQNASGIPEARKSRLVYEDRTVKELRKMHDELLEEVRTNPNRSPPDGGEGVGSRGGDVRS